ERGNRVVVEVPEVHPFRLGPDDPRQGPDAQLSHRRLLWRLGCDRRLLWRLGCDRRLLWRRGCDRRLVLDDRLHLLPPAAPFVVLGEQPQQGADGTVETGQLLGAHVVAQQVLLLLLPGPAYLLDQRQSFGGEADDDL